MGCCCGEVYKGSIAWLPLGWVAASEGTAAVAAVIQMTAVAAAAAAADGMAWLPMDAPAAAAGAAPVARIPAMGGLVAAAAPVARIHALAGMAAEAQMAVEDFPARQNSIKSHAVCVDVGLPPGCLGQKRGAFVVPRRKLDGGASSL